MLGTVLFILGLVLLLAFLGGVLLLLVITLVQWRDLVSFDRWTEVMVTIGRNKLRTALTMISVAWGIFVLVTLLGVGNGLDRGMRKNFARDATNGVWIIANKTSVAYGGYDVGRRLMFDNRDYERARRVAGVEHITGAHWIGGSRWGSALPTTRGGKANTFPIDAIHPEGLALESHTMSEGRFLTAGDIRERRKAVVIGETVAGFLFQPGEVRVGEWIVIGGVPFQVVGVFANERGADEERKIYMPISTAQLAFNGSEKVGMLALTVGQANAEETQSIVNRIVAQLSERHDFDPSDPQAVRVHNNIEQFERFTNLFMMMSMFIVVIGLGTLAAGVVGVSNIMMIAVKERTKEIGVRKALGATPWSIVFMVIQEAVFLTGVAGLLGLSAGVGALELIGRFVESDFIVSPSIDIKLGIAATAFLVLAGALAGLFPALAAARVNPIHALRDQ